ncbi:hypothetical protein DFJ77DRAFT_465774 [Powellomyces hirtus]|nr:hypothetical protein DFJ77DRAFT_465774 [Powellomyces hirtus]
MGGIHVCMLVNPVRQTPGARRLHACAVQSLFTLGTFTHITLVITLMNLTIAPAYTMLSITIPVLTAIIAIALAVVPIVAHPAQGFRDALELAREEGCDVAEMPNGFGGEGDVAVAIPLTRIPPTPATTASSRAASNPLPNSFPDPTRPRPRPPPSPHPPVSLSIAYPNRVTRFVPAAWAIAPAVATSPAVSMPMKPSGRDAIWAADPTCVMVSPVRPQRVEKRVRVERTMQW